MRWEEVHLKWYCIEILVPKLWWQNKITGFASDNPARKGVPFCDDESFDRELGTRVSRIFLRKEIKRLLEKTEASCFGVFFQNMKIFPNDISNFEIDRTISYL